MVYLRIVVATSRAAWLYSPPWSTAWTKGSVLIVQDLADNHELDNTLILFLSDNGACAEWDPNGFDGRSSNNNVLHTGEELAGMGGPDTYHSVGSGWANLSNTPWRLYKHFNHEGGISTPMIVHWPGGLPRSGFVEATPGHTVDLVPTLLDAAGAEYPRTLDGRATIPLPGQSLLPVLKGTKSAERTLFFEHEGHRAVRQGPYKLVARRGRPWELYKHQRRSDRAERSSRAGAGASSSDGPGLGAVGRREFRYPSPERL